jgi:tetratricopeptide (TPR) repeat protein
MSLQNNILHLIEEKRIQEAKELINNNVASKALYYYFYGLCCCSEEKFINAIFFFKLSNLNGFDHYLLHYNLGVAYLSIGNFNNSLKNFQKSVILNRNFIKNYINIAYIYCRKKDIKNAYRSIKTGLAYNDCSELKSLEDKLFPLMIIGG